MKRSDNIAAIAVALSKFQAECPPVTKDGHVKVRMKTGGTFEFPYATLPNIQKTIAPHLCKNELSYAQDPRTTKDGKWVKCKTLVMHGSGQWLLGVYSLPIPPGCNAQGVGSITTYAKRYSLTAILGVKADNDDDGNSALGQEIENIKGKGNGKPQAKPPQEEKKTTRRRRVRLTTGGRAYQNALDKLKTGEINMQNILKAYILPDDMLKEFEAIQAENDKKADNAG